MATPHPFGGAAAMMPPQDPRQRMGDPRRSPPLQNEAFTDHDFEVIDEVEWADDKDSSGELAPRPKYDKNSDPCGCKPDYGSNSEPCCNDMSCILFACQEECRNNCEAGALCQNKRITRKEWKQLQVFDAGVKGKGLRTMESVQKGELITEYVGRAIRKGYLDMLFKRYRNERMLYIMALDKDTYIDARKKGGMARYINHSCEPNCIVNRWKVRGILRAGVFALRDIAPGEELCFDYKWDRKRGRAPTKCHCMTPSCRGTLELPKSMEEDELERRLLGHWKKPPDASKAGSEIINRSIKILSEEHHEYFSADVCKYDESTGKHLVIYRHDLEEVWEDLSKEDWMILDEEAEQFVIAKKIQPISSSSLLGPGLVVPSNGEAMRPVKNYMFVQTPVKDQFIGRHLIERCQRNCHVQIDITPCMNTYETPLPDDEEGLELQRAFEKSDDRTVWKLTVSGFNVAKAYTILEKNVEFIEKMIQATAEANVGEWPSVAATQGEVQEVIIPRCIVEQVKRRLSEIRDRCRSVNITFAHSESKSKQFSRLILEATLASDLEVAKQHVWTKLVSICCEANAPMAPSGIYKDLGFLGGELSGDQFRLLLSDEDKEKLSQDCAEDLRRSPFFSSFESAHRCTVWVQSLEDKGRIDRNNLIVNEGSPNAPRKVYFGCAPTEVPKLWDLVQVRASELSRGVRYLHLGGDRMYQQSMMQNGGKFFDYVKQVAAVNVTIDSTTGDHLRIDGRTNEVPVSEDLPSSESERVSLAEDVIKLQIELYRDHNIRQQNWIFGRDWTLISTGSSSASVNSPSAAEKSISTSKSPTPTRSRFETRSIASACVEIADVVSNLELSATVAAHAAIILYRYISVVSNHESPNGQLKIRELLLGCVFLANKAQKVSKWKRMDSLLEAAYKTFYPGSAFSTDNEEVTILEKRVISAETEILRALQYDIFWRGTDWILTTASESGGIAGPLAHNVFELAFSGPVLAAGSTLWLKYGAEYVYAAVAGFLSVDIEKLMTALSLIPIKVSQAAEIIADAIKAGPAGRKSGSHSFFTGGSEAIAKQVPVIRETCINFMSKGILPGASTQTLTSESLKMYEIMGRRDNRQRIFHAVQGSAVRERILPVIDGLCAESNCKIFLKESERGGDDIIMQGSWRALAIAEYLLMTMCEIGPHEIQSPEDGFVDRGMSSSVSAKVHPGLMNMSVVDTNEGWKGTIQSKILDGDPSWGQKVGGKCCVAGKISEDSVRQSGLRWWIPPSYAPSPSGAICDMVGIHGNATDLRRSDDLGKLAVLARDLVGDVQSLELFPTLMTFSSGAKDAAGRFMAVSLQRWPSEKVSNREDRTRKGSPLGVSPAALQEMDLLVQLHSLIPSPQGHPNFILPVAISLTPEEADLHDSPIKPAASADDDIFSLFRSSEDNEKVANKEKKKRINLATGAHLVFHPTPFVLQRFTSRSRHSGGDSSSDQNLPPSLLTCWFHDLLSALAHCHENHVVLRALQPDQIVIDHSGVAKLGGLYRATVLPSNERRKSPNALKSARSRRKDDAEDTTSAYLAPEILLGSTKYTKETDVWSMGALFAHILLNKSLFVGKDRSSLLLAIFKIVGMPSKDNYPEGSKFPFFTKPPKKYKRGVQRALRTLIGDEEAQKHALVIDLLDQMLHLDPRKRITAADALKHECMLEFVETCRTDAFRRQYVNDWMALKQRFLQARKSADRDVRKQEGTMKRKALLLAASSQDRNDDADDDLYGDLLGGGAKKRFKWNEP